MRPLILLSSFFIAIISTPDLFAQTHPSANSQHQQNCKISLPYQVEEYPNCSPQSAAAYDFAFCYVHYIMVSHTAPASDKMLGSRSKSKEFEEKGIAYANLSTELTDKETFQRNVAITKKYYESLSGHETQYDAALVSIRNKCDSVLASHAQTIIEFLKKSKNKANEK